MIGCRGAVPLLVPPEDVPATLRDFLSDSLSSSLDDDILGFALLVGRWGDDSEPEDGSIFTFAAGAGETSLFKVGVSSILVSSCFDGSMEPETKLSIFLSAGLSSSGSDSVAESGSIGFT